jgi:hydrogenase expression/formation protein HypE
MRDPTRGGLATVCTEIVRATSYGLRLQQDAIPVRDEVTSVCEMLGYDPLYLACEGRVVAIVDPGRADELVASWQSFEEGSGAVIVGHIDSQFNHVVMQTPIGGERILDELEDDPLPRIC